MCHICILPKRGAYKSGCGGIVPIAVGKLDSRFEICVKYLGSCVVQIWLRSLDDRAGIGSNIGLPYSKQTFKKYKINREVCDIVLGHLLGLNRYFKVKEINCKMTVYKKKTYTVLLPEEECVFLLNQ